MDLKVTSALSNGVCRVTAEGEVDVSNADALKDAIAAPLGDGEVSQIVIDLTDVPYIDSTGIGVLVGAEHRALEAGKKLSAVGVQPNVARVFGMLGVEGMIAGE